MAKSVAVHKVMRLPNGRRGPEPQLIISPRARNSPSAGLRPSRCMSRPGTFCWPDAGRKARARRAYLPLSVVRDLVNTPIDGQSLFAILAESYGVGLTMAESIIEVTRSDPADSEMPGIAAGSQALLVESVTFDSKDYPVEFSRVIYRADRFGFALKSHRRTGRVVHVLGHPN